MSVSVSKTVCCVNLWTRPISHMVTCCHWEACCASKTVDVAVHLPARSNYPHCSLPNGKRLYHCLFWLAAHLASVCLVWHLAAISQRPTECMAPGYGPSKRRSFGFALTVSDLAWCSLSNHLLFILSRSGQVVNRCGKAEAHQSFKWACYSLVQSHGLNIVNEKPKDV